MSERQLVVRFGSGGRVTGSFGIFADVVNRDGSSRLLAATLTPLS